VLQKISACMTAKPVACPLSRTDASGSSAATFISTPMTRTWSGYCARAANGHTVAAAPSNVMKWRRFMPKLAFSVYPTIKLPQSGRQVFGADLNCSESK
jgi:hypothetical protein